ncbi:unnamed protein product [Polarella glacialis]|uniref:Uncharacterized protein n=1 Tax=Polarella glacialis TaxID=89957 RepID=A0A813KGI5_POLGL|nr:unnamed protein product [Polarella glacialis]
MTGFVSSWKQDFESSRASHKHLCFDKLSVADCKVQPKHNCETVCTSAFPKGQQSGRLVLRMLNFSSGRASTVQNQKTFRSTPAFLTDVMDLLGGTARGAQKWPAQTDFSHATTAGTCRTEIRGHCFERPLTMQLLLLDVQSETIRQEGVCSRFRRINETTGAEDNAAAPWAKRSCTGRRVNFASEGGSRRNFQQWHD